MIIFSERFKAARLKRGLSQKELATILGVSENKIKSWETGTSYPKYDNLIKIVRFFGVKLDYLLGLID